MSEIAKAYKALYESGGIAYDDIPEEVRDEIGI